jgi:hypothetical protein
MEQVVHRDHMRNSLAQKKVRRLIYAAKPGIHMVRAETLAAAELQTTASARESEERETRAAARPALALRLISAALTIAVAVPIVAGSGCSSADLVNPAHPTHRDNASAPPSDAAVAVVMPDVGRPTISDLPSPGALIAILGLEVYDNGSGIDPETARAARELTAALRDCAKARTGPYRPVGGEKALIDEKLLNNCDSEAPTCMAAIGNGLGADVLMYGKMEKATQNGQGVYKVSIKLLSVGRKQLRSSTVETLPVAESTGIRATTHAKAWYAKLAGAVSAERSRSRRTSIAAPCCSRTRPAATCRAARSR